MTLRRLIKRGGPAAWHVTPAHAASYADGSLPETDAWSVEKHVESCAACAERVSTAVRAGAAAPALADIRAAVLAFAEAGVGAEAAEGAAGASPAAPVAPAATGAAARDTADAGAPLAAPASPRPAAAGGTAAGAGGATGAETPDLVAARDTAPGAPHHPAAPAFAEAGAAATARHAEQAAARSAMASGRADGPRGPADIVGTAPAVARQASGGALGPAPQGRAATDGPQEAASLSGTAAAVPASIATRPATEAQTPDLVAAASDLALVRRGQEAAATAADSRDRGPRRFGLRLGLGAVRRSRGWVAWAAGPAVRGPWLVAMLVTGVVAAGAARAAGVSGVRPLLLALAPVLPSAGVAVSYGRHADPMHELAASTPSGGLRLLLTRTAAVLAVSVPLLTLVGQLLPAAAGAPAASAWLLPGLALTLAALALASYVGCRIATCAVTAGWLLAVGAPALLVGPADGERVPLADAVSDSLVTVLSGPAAQSCWAAAAAVCAGLLALRRTSFDRLERM
ncbi:zf-HC2 domain-containing protein [Streptomyces sp. NPDC020845]|uniref:zf-HC2 domain-containing protein n=1 Tax=Streptomyces sp. NPDC020845 TaxID=3365096 RepID=UPI00379384D7